jgi:hypothetical protein
MRPYDAPVTIIGTKRPAGATIPQLKTVKKRHMKKNINIDENSNSLSVFMLNRFLIASSFVLKMRLARPL